MSDIERVVDQIMKQIGSSSVNAIFGEPCQFESRVVIPVGKISYGWGGGGGKAETGNEEKQEEKNKGMGFGMGAKVMPVGYITVTKDNVTFQPVMDITPVCVVWSVIGGTALLMSLKFILVSSLIKKRRRVS